jgi:hypothetical protein
MPFPRDPNAPGGPERSIYLRAAMRRPASIASVEPAAPAAIAASAQPVPFFSIPISTSGPIAAISTRL